MLKSIFNLCEIYSGQIVFSASSGENKELTNLPTHQLIKLGISYVPQGRQIFSTLTVKENLEMGAFVLDPRLKIKDLKEKIYKFFPILKERQNDYAFTLSGGQQQILAIARALIQNPKLLLLDEPSLGLDPKTRKEIFEKIVEINKEGTSIIIVEQNAKQAVEIAHKTYVLENGRIVLMGGEEILKDDKIKSIYFGGI